MTRRARGLSHEAANGGFLGFDLTNRPVEVVEAAVSSLILAVKLSKLQEARSPVRTCLPHWLDDLVATQEAVELKGPKCIIGVD